MYAYILSRILSFNAEILQRLDGSRLQLGHFQVQAVEDHRRSRDPFLKNDRLGRLAAITGRIRNLIKIS